ncbi:MAG TPA: hydroxypyruvate isomerase [Gemmatimonadaceae bacterium]|nr:hydroxypyruvate isomerase [Gemmatimonadaceae bacterium]
MPRFAANLTMLFTEVPFLERFARAAAAGFSAVEFLFPYPYDAHELRALLDRNGLQLVLHNLPAGDWDAGERGIACIPGREAEFREGVARGIAYAQALGVPRVNCLVGKTLRDVDPAAVHATLVANLRYAANALNAAGLQLLVEAINPFDIPGFHLTTTAQVLALLDEVGAPNVRVQYDIYHAQRTEGELAGTLSRHLPRIGHVQLADNPGRHEPGTGEINYRFLFAHLDRIGYDGYVGCEYKPAGVTEDGLGWMTALTS